MREAAASLAVSPDFVYRRIAAGELPVHRVGRLLRIDPDDLADFVVVPGGRPRGS